MNHFFVHAKAVSKKRLLVKDLVNYDHGNDKGNHVGEWCRLTEVQLCEVVIRVHMRVYFANEGPAVAE